LPNEAEANAFASPLKAALAQLLKALAYARDVGCDPWEFAVELDRLTDLGVTTTDLRWLVKKGYIEHACETTKPGDAQRRFEQRQNLAFTKTSCFRLATTAMTVVESLPVREPGAMDAVPAMVAPAIANSGSTPGLPLPDATHQVLELSASSKSPWTPHWDADDRTLYVGHLIVKEYRVRSPNQEAVLSAFEEEGWPHYIDDPLSPVGDQSPKQRLRDTIKCLNANQKHRLIRFRGDGTGERVRWETVAPSE
jgi:hypothetical protein